MGYAGNCEPQYIIPTTIATPSAAGGGSGASASARTVSGVDNKVKGGVEDLDFFIGTECAEHTSTHQINYPIRHGLIENW